LPKRNIPAPLPLAWARRSRKNNVPAPHGKEEANERSFLAASSREREAEKEELGKGNFGLLSAWSAIYGVVDFLFFPVTLVLICLL
jgi:hypothetical protein